MTEHLSNPPMILPQYPKPPTEQVRSRTGRHRSKHLTTTDDPARPRDAIPVDSGIEAPPGRHYTKLHQWRVSYLLQYAEIMLTSLALSA